MKQHIAVLFVLSALITTCLAAEPKTVQVTFYHTSDIHEHSAPLPRIAGFVAAQKKRGTNVLFVDTGDWCNKGDFTALKTRGEAITAMLGACQYDAMIPGNHDYSFGTKRLAKLIGRFSLPVVAANCVWPEDIKPQGAVPYRLFELDGVTVAVIGTATPISSQRTDTLLKILPIAESLRDVVAKVKPRADIIAVLTHCGTSADEKLAQALPDIDIIFGGHHHKKFETLTLAPNTDTVIQHSGAEGQFLGELTVSWNGQKIVGHEVRLVRVTDNLPISPTVSRIRDEYLSVPAAESSSRSK